MRKTVSFSNLRLPFLALLTGVCMALPAGAADAPGAVKQQGDADRSAPGLVVTGGWVVGVGVNAATSISFSDVPRWYVVAAHTPFYKASVQVTVDGVDSNYPVNASGAALVWGKKVSVKTYLDSNGSAGGWAIYDEKLAPLPEVEWAIHPSTNTEAVVAMLDAPREFVLSFNVGAPAEDCPTGVLTPFVDDKALADPNGNTLTLQPGASIVAKGKKVRIRVTGKCSEGRRFFGTIKLL